MQLATALRLHQSALIDRMGTYSIAEYNLQKTVQYYKDEINGAQTNKDAQYFTQQLEDVLSAFGKKLSDVGGVSNPMLEKAVRDNQDLMNAKLKFGVNFDNNTQVKNNAVAKMGGDEKVLDEAKNNAQKTEKVMKKVSRAMASGASFAAILNILMDPDSMGLDPALDPNEINKLKKQHIFSENNIKKLTESLLEQSTSAVAQRESKTQTKSIKSFVA